MFIQAESHSDGIMTQEIMLGKEKQQKKKHVYCKISTKPLEVEFSRERGLLQTGEGGEGCLLSVRVHMKAVKWPFWAFGNTLLQNSDSNKYIWRLNTSKRLFSGSQIVMIKIKK